MGRGFDPHIPPLAMSLYSLIINHWIQKLVRLLQPQYNETSQLIPPMGVAKMVLILRWSQL